MPWNWSKYKSSCWTFQFIFDLTYKYTFRRITSNNGKKRRHFPERMYGWSRAQLSVLLSVRWKISLGDPQKEIQFTWSKGRSLSNVYNHVIFIRTNQILRFNLVFEVTFSTTDTRHRMNCHQHYFHVFKLFWGHSTPCKRNGTIGKEWNCWNRLQLKYITGWLDNQLDFLCLHELYQSNSCRYQEVAGS